ncbi:hypothetical protein VISI1226_03985 [Vibrio sinaloensis DSM 21326]|uniref:Uncharacterized protein n=1 Tax=Vibrio sinaloensis DSM 21326 TaxID=945550 RepID=E8MCK3_PHOS4|nr:hypothetical protein [Vibrio sinaloensis]EGA68246.1 hypothetical protein VISI1226_03985 [Vibrio sinaloensis DSM 21326]
MKYLTVDGMFSGTGIRDSVEGGYLKPEILGLSTELKNKISDWLSRYEDEHYEQYEDDSIVARLDAEGVEICNLLKSELPHSKVEYYSTAKMKKVIID